MLTSGLLVGSASGAIAAADTDSTGSASSTTQSASQTSDVDSAAGPTTSTANKPISQLSTSIQSVLDKLRSLGKPVQKPPVVVKPTTDAAAPDSTANDPKSDDVSAAAADPGASKSNGGAGDPSATPVAAHLAASKAGGPPPDVVTPALAEIQPVTNSVATVAGVALTVPGVVAALPGSKTPVADVVTSLQSMLVTVDRAVAQLAQVPGDIFSLMVTAGTYAATVQPIATASGTGISAVAGTGLTPPIQPFAAPILPISFGAGTPALGDVIAPAMLGGTVAAGLAADLSLSGTAPLAVGGAAPADALSLLENTVKAVLAPASLTALAAFALPGIAGLLIICAAGMRLGYRQAKAALAIRTTGISRFARQGPLGVVRSGSLVALHSRRPRALRAVRPMASRAAPPLEQAA